jgi:hypothetical protein
LRLCAQSQLPPYPKIVRAIRANPSPTVKYQSLRPIISRTGRTDDFECH